MSTHFPSPPVNCLPPKPFHMLPTLTLCAKFYSFSSLICFHYLRDHCRKSYAYIRIILCEIHNSFSFCNLAERNIRLHNSVHIIFVLVNVFMLCEGQTGPSWNIDVFLVVPPSSSQRSQHTSSHQPCKWPYQETTSPSYLYVGCLYSSTVHVLLETNCPLEPLSS